MAKDRAPYQPRLRALGAYLDGVAATSCSVIESEGGFLARWHRRQQDAALGAIVLSNMDLLSLQEVDLRLRPSTERGAAGVASPGRYQDLFRALGHELDRQEAAFLVLDEIEGSLLVSYHYVDPARHYMWQKQLTVLDAEAQHRLVQQARGRRVVARSRGADRMPPKVRERGQEVREAHGEASATWVPGC